MKWIIILLVVAVIAVVAMGPLMSRVERPRYNVESTLRGIEVRAYAPMIIAEVEVSGERKPAIQAGFKILADYIFGNNTSQQKIAMTAPVTQQANEKIAMTAPVAQQRSGDQWKVQFTMPSRYTLATLPTPKDPRVHITQIPAKRFVVIEFSGMNDEANLTKHRALLLQAIQDQHLKVVGEPIMAFYNPPWTLPFMRRNEIMLELQP